ncbi:Nramp family divalent metal transporter [Candidatus Roizmanbacteria bacterium]|nr:Nramp family divalent metal transporter [Candidatus Roizmanbacteria bacterium]
MKNKIKKFLRVLGPGFVTGASDDDPSGIATYAQTGALFGYGQLWTALFSFPFMTAIQEMCGRIGMVTGRGLSGVLRKHYSKTILYAAVFLLIIANTINIGADLGAMASSAQLLLGIPFAFWLIVMTATTLILEIFVSYKVYSKFLKYLAFSLLAYIATVFVVKQDWLEVLSSTLIPTFTFSGAYLLNIVAILGTTISPYLFFWQSDEEVEEEIAHHKLRMMGAGVPKITKRDLREMKVDTAIGMFFSNLVMFFIIVTTASTLFVGGVTNIETADQAAQALRPLAGDFAFLLFAAGIIGTGLLSVPILAGSASYALSEAFGWKAGLYRKATQARGFYGIITVATLIGLLVNLTPIKPFKMLYLTAIFNGIAAPPLMLLILLISNNKNVMGQHTNSKISNILGLAITGVMGAAAVALFISLFRPS